MKSYERDVLERLKKLLELKEDLDGPEMAQLSRDLYQHIVATLRAEEEIYGQPLESGDEPE